MSQRRSIASTEGDDVEDYKILEESPCGRWNKSDTEISVQKLLDFDTTHVGIDTEKGVEIAWNEMKYVHEPKNNFCNRFESAATLKSIYEKLKCVLEFLLKLDHSNILKFYDYWYEENDFETKVVIITEYSTAGSLKKVLDKSKMSLTKVKTSTAKRWLNQILYSVKYLHSEKISIFQGYISSETIFIQNSCVIKLTPTLLRLTGVCEISKNVIRRSNSPFSVSKCEKTKPKIMKLSNEIIQKDINAIGTIALEIFTAHIKTKKSDNPVTGGSSHCEDMLENDFVSKCFEFDSNTIDSIWYHPFINDIYGLKVLSVYSILAYFQEKNIKSKSNIDSIVTHIKTKMISRESDDVFSVKPLSKELTISDPIEMDRISIDEETKSQENMIIHRNSSSENICGPAFIKPTIQNYVHNSTGNLKQRRKVSLSFLQNFNNITIPQDFFSILDDIRYGLYPRLFTESEYKELTAQPSIKSITSSTCLEFVKQQKQIIDIRSSLLNINNVFLNDLNDRKDLPVSTIILPSFEEEGIGKNDEAFRESVATSNTALDDNLVKELYETRRINSGECYVNQTDDESMMIELNLRFKFDDNSQRSLQCYFPNNFFLLLENFEDLTKEFNIKNSNFLLNDASKIDLSEIEEKTTFLNKIENICHHLTNELVDFGLVSFHDQMTIKELFFSTIKKYIF